MKVDRKNIAKKICLGLALCCLIIPNALAILVETVKYNESTTASNSITDGLGEAIQGVDKKEINQASNSPAHRKDVALVSFIKADGQLFFEMRGEHILASESSAVALFLLGFLGLFSRRWP